MRFELLYNPRLLCERLAIESARRRRLGSLRGTPGGGLALGHIDTLELVELAREAGISVIYDIGANVGTWSLMATSLIPSACIHAFEPLPKH
ncbi:MAG: methyltransferase, FkbM family, partial [Candidatus Sulfotelmatobacter sp.]|nr:methyltransferase, FkbM family [Candidatus Sulfotelmatobacter sp.]